MTVIDDIEKRQKSRFWGIFTEIVVAKPKVNIHSKIESLFYLRSDFFVLIRFPGPSYSLLFWCILALPRFLTSRLHCIVGNSHSHSDLPRQFRACNSQWSQISKYAMVGQEIHQKSSPKVTSFRSGHFSSSKSDKPNSQTKYITVLASFKKETLSYRHPSGSH